VTVNRPGESALDRVVGWFTVSLLQTVPGLAQELAQTSQHGAAGWHNEHRLSAALLGFSQGIVTTLVGKIGKIV
jgi:hypothetical protein